MLPYMVRKSVRRKIVSEDLPSLNIKWLAGNKGSVMKEKSPRWALGYTAGWNHYSLCDTSLYLQVRRGHLLTDAISFLSTFTSLLFHVVPLSELILDLSTTEVSIPSPLR